LPKYYGPKNYNRNKYRRKVIENVENSIEIGEENKEKSKIIISQNHTPLCGAHQYASKGIQFVIFSSKLKGILNGLKFKPILIGK
jgi:hypothetical protein